MLLSKSSRVSHGGFDVEAMTPQPKLADTWALPACTASPGKAALGGGPKRDPQARGLPSSGRPHGTGAGPTTLVASNAWVCSGLSVLGCLPGGGCTWAGRAQSCLPCPVCPSPGMSQLSLASSATWPLGSSPAETSRGRQSCCCPFSLSPSLTFPRGEEVIRDLSYSYILLGT